MGGVSTTDLSDYDKAAALRAGDYPKDAKEGVHTNVPQEHAPDVADADVKE